MAKPNPTATYGSSSEELAHPGDVSREHVLNRLQDWRDRVHALYADIERGLKNSGLRIDREGKHTSAEELPQRAGIAAHDQPQIDILRIVRPDGTNAAILFPRGLWVIGANGWVDLRIVPPVGGSEVYVLLDQSGPLSGPAQWVRMPIGAPFDRKAFDAAWLAAKLQ